MIKTKEEILEDIARGDMKYIEGTDRLYICRTDGIVYGLYEACGYPHYARINNMGYGRVRIRVNGKHKEFLSHRLVALHFIKRRRGRKQVNHIDANKLNNNYKNLEWCTPKENMQHASRMGLLGKKRYLRQPIDTA